MDIFSCLPISLGLNLASASKNTSRPSGPLTFTKHMSPSEFKQRNVVIIHYEFKTSDNTTTDMGSQKKFSSKDTVAFILRWASLPKQTGLKIENWAWVVFYKYSGQPMSPNEDRTKAGTTGTTTTVSDHDARPRATCKFTVRCGYLPSSWFATIVFVLTRRTQWCV